MSAPILDFLAHFINCLPINLFCFYLLLRQPFIKVLPVLMQPCLGLSVLSAFVKNGLACQVREAEDTLNLPQGNMRGTNEVLASFF